MVIYFIIIAIKMEYIFIIFILSGFENYRADILAMLGPKIAFSRAFDIFKWSFLITCPGLFLVKIKEFVIFIEFKYY